MRYLVIEQYFDSGKTKAVIKEVPDDYVAAEQIRGVSSDIYEFVFSTYAEAAREAGACRNA